jgi:membrane protein
MKKVRLKDLSKIFKKTYEKWNAKDPFRESSVIAYYAIFSIPALLVIVVGVAGFFFGRAEVNDYLYQQIKDAIGESTADTIKTMINRASNSGNSQSAAIMGFVTLLIGATGVFAQLQKTLNIIWEVKANPKKQNIWTTIRTRLFSFGLILSIGFLLLISLVITSLLSAVANHFKSSWPQGIMFGYYTINFIASLTIISVLFALIFKILPDVHIRWRFVRLGAIITGLLFVLGKYALGIYFSSADPASVYGATGSVVLILLWVSYSSMILFFGAEFTKIYSDFNEAAPRPKSIAVKKQWRGENI